MKHIPLLDLTAQHEGIVGELREAFEEMLRSSDFIQGTHVREFEREFGEYVGVRHAIACANGTEAITLALIALGIGPGDRVVLPSLTFIATATAVLHAGGCPEFVDVDPLTELMTAEHLESLLAKERGSPGRIKAVIPVHLRGNPCEMDRILEVARAHSLFVIEDAAQAHGALYQGRKVGSFGDAAAFSFFPGKNLGALGDGGMVVTGDPAVAAAVRKLRDHGRASKYLHEIVGYNSRLDTLQAAWLRIKLRHLDDWNGRRREVAALYKENLKGANSLSLPTVTPGGTSVFHHFAVRTKERDGLAKHLATKGISTGIHYPVPAHRQPALAKDYPGLRLPHTDAICAETLSLPIFPELTPIRVVEICGLATQYLHRPKP